MGWGTGGEEVGWPHASLFRTLLQRRSLGWVPACGWPEVKPMQLCTAGPSAWNVHPSQGWAVLQLTRGWAQWEGLPARSGDFPLDSARLEIGKSSS